MLTITNGRILHIRRFNSYFVTIRYDDVVCIINFRNHTSLLWCHAKRWPVWRAWLSSDLYLSFRYAGFVNSPFCDVLFVESHVFWMYDVSGIKQVKYLHAIHSAQIYTKLSVICHLGIFSLSVYVYIRCTPKQRNIQNAKLFGALSSNDSRAVIFFITLEIVQLFKAAAWLWSSPNISKLCWHLSTSLWPYSLTCSSFFPPTYSNVDCKV